MKTKKYTKKESEILDIITSFCQTECPSCGMCPEEECLLYRIEKVITDNKE